MKERKKERKKGKQILSINRSFFAKKRFFRVKMQQPKKSPCKCLGPASKWTKPVSCQRDGNSSTRRKLVDPTEIRRINFHQIKTHQVTTNEMKICQNKKNWTKFVKCNLNKNSSNWWNKIQTKLSLNKSSSQMKTHQMKIHQMKIHLMKIHQMKSHQMKSHQMKSHQMKSHQMKSHQMKTHKMKTHQMKSHQMKTH